MNDKVEPFEKSDVGPYLECTCGCGFTVSVVDVTPEGEVRGFVAEIPETVIERMSE